MFSFDEIYKIFYSIRNDERLALYFELNPDSKTFELIKRFNQEVPFIEQETVFKRTCEHNKYMVLDFDLYSKFSMFEKIVNSFYDDIKRLQTKENIKTFINEIKNKYIGYKNSNYKRIVVPNIEKSIMSKQYEEFDDVISEINYFIDYTKVHDLILELIEEINNIKKSITNLERHYIQQSYDVYKNKKDLEKRLEDINKNKECLYNMYNLLKNINILILCTNYLENSEVFTKYKEIIDIVKEAE